MSDSEPASGVAPPKEYSKEKLKQRKEKGSDSMSRKIGFDRALLDEKIISEDDGSIVFGAVIAREMVQPYPEGMAYKPAEELEKAAWTADGRWLTTEKHPDTQLLIRREDIKGRVENPRFVKDLIEPKTKRPMDRGIKADLRFYKKNIPPQILADVKNGALRDVSIGFLYDEDKTPGEFRDQKYDFVQRNIFIDHVAAAVPVGRCSSPYCGIGIDELGKVKDMKIGLDPYKTIAELPDAVKVLPEEAQEMFLKVVNAALEQYEGNEERAFKVAWAAVKGKWEKVDDKWVKKKEAAGDKMSLVDIQSKIEGLYDKRDKLRETERGLYKEKQVDPEVEKIWRQVEDIDLEVRALKDLKAKKIVEESDCAVCKERDRLGNLEFSMRLIKTFGKDAVLNAVKDQEEKEREKLHEAAAARATKHGIGFKEGGHLTPPEGYPTEESKYADPVNFRYPIDDEEHIRAAWAYCSKEENKAKGGYSEAEWGKIHDRVKKAMKGLGAELAEEKEAEDQVERARRLMQLL